VARRTTCPASAGKQWYAAAEAGLRRLQEHCRQAFVCGFSMGATGLLRQVMTWYYPLAKANFADPAVRTAVLDRAPAADLDDPTVVAQIRREAKVPVGSLYEMVRLQQAARRDLRRVSAPALIMQGRNDQTVDPRSAAELAACLDASTPFRRPAAAARIRGRNWAIYNSILKTVAGIVHVQGG